MGELSIKGQMCLLQQPALTADTDREKPASAYPAWLTVVPRAKPAEESSKSYGLILPSEHFQGTMGHELTHESDKGRENSPYSLGCLITSTDTFVVLTQSLPF